MEAHIYKHKNRFSVRHEYDRVLIDYYSDIPGRFFDREKKEWLFGNEHLDSVINWLKYTKYNIVEHDRTTSAVLFAFGPALYLKYSFEPDTLKEFEKEFPQHKFDEEEGDYTFELKDYPALKEFFDKNCLKFTYLNSQVQSLFSYIKNKVQKIEETQKKKQEKETSPVRKQAVISNSKPTEKERKNGFDEYTAKRKSK